MDLQLHLDAIRMPAPPVALEPKQNAYLEDCLRIHNRRWEPEGDSFLSYVHFHPVRQTCHPALRIPPEQFSRQAGLVYQLPDKRRIEMSLFEYEDDNSALCTAIRSNECFDRVVLSWYIYSPLSVLYAHVLFDRCSVTKRESGIGRGGLESRSSLSYV